MKVKKRVDFVRENIQDSNAEGVKFYPIITARDGAPNFAMRLFEIEPGGHTPLHTHKWEHEVYVIDGNGFVVGENKKIRIEKDDCVFIEPSELHQFIAGEEGIRIICIVPNSGQPCPICNG